LGQKYLFKEEFSMTNTKFRKRALLSSVAMLLVALVALGSATFAWFVKDPTADAKGLTAKAQSSTGLQIRSESSTKFSHHAKIAAQTSETGGAAFTGVILSPAMTTDGTAFHTVQAAAADDYKGDTNEKWAEATVNDHTESNGVYKETITLKKTGTDTTAEAVYLTKLDLATTGTMASAVVVELVVGNTVYVYNTTGTAVKKWTSAVTDGTTKYVEANATWTQTKSISTLTGTSAANSQEIGSLKGGQELTVDLYVYLDGENSTVKSDNAVSAQEIISKCDLYFALASNWS
jgi:hypothetical protein